MNPFLSISPKKDNPLFGIDISKIKYYAKKISEGNTIVIISGQLGSGKSAVVMAIEKALPRTMHKVKLICSPGLNESLKSIKVKGKTVIIIEKFYMAVAFGEKELKAILNTIGEMLNKNTSFIITSTPELAATIPQLSEKIKNVHIFDVPQLSFEDAKKLIIWRLNQVREKESESLEPFTESELMHIWKTSKGNPKMILLLCASLYDAKRGKLQ